MLTVKGKAMFKCRNLEEANWLSLLLNRFFEETYVFPLSRKPFNLDYYYDVGIYSTVSIKSNNIYLIIHVDDTIEEEKIPSITLSLFFLSRQTKVIDCNIIIEGEKVGDLEFFVKSDETGEIEYKKYYYKIHPVSIGNQFSFYELINRFKIFDEIIFKTTKNLPIAYQLKKNIILIRSDDSYEYYTMKNVFNKIFTLLFRRRDLFKRLYELNQNFKNYNEWKRIIDKYQVKQIDINQLLSNYDYLDSLDIDSSEDDLFKLQAIYNRIISAIEKYVKIEENDLIFRMSYKDNFLSNQFIHSEFKIFFDSIVDSIILDFGYANLKAVMTIEDYFIKRFRMNFKEKNKDFITHISKWLSRKYYSDKNHSISFVKLLDFKKDFYEYCREFPKVYITETLHFPLERHFVSLYYEEFKEKKLIKQIDDTYRLQSKVELKTNRLPSLCEMCVHRIRKTTIGCNGCFDFKLTL